MRTARNDLTVKRPRRFALLLCCGATTATAFLACSPDKISRGPVQAMGGSAGNASGGTPGSGGNKGSGGVTPTTSAGSGGNGGPGTGGYTYVPPSSGGAGGTSTVTWTTLPVGNKDAAPLEVCNPAAAPSSGRGHQVLMVVKSIASPGIMPALHKTHLEARGFKVDYAFIYTSSFKTDAGSFSNLWFFDDAKTQMVDVSQYGLAVISKDGYKSGANLEAIPVLCGNNQTADTYLAMATSDGSSSPTKGAFTLLDAKHPIAAKQTGDIAGTVLLETGPSPVQKPYLATVPASAHIVGVDWGTTAPGTSSAALFAYEVGDLLADGTAAKARRVGFFLDDSTSWGAVVAGSLTWQFFDASVDWLLGLTPCGGSGSTATAADASMAID